MGERVREINGIPAKLMKEDLGRIAQWVEFTKSLTPVALENLGVKQFGESIGRVNEFVRSTGEEKTSLDYMLIQGIGHSPRILFDAINDAFIKSQVLKTDSEKKNLAEFISGQKEFSLNDESKFDCDVKNEALKVYSALLFTRDLFTIFSNLLPTLARIEKLLTLQSVLLAEFSHCSGVSHPVATALRKMHAEGLIPWKGNGEALDDGPAMEIFERLKPHLSSGHPVPPDFPSFAKVYPSWDAFWQIATWKSFRMEKAIEAVTRELLVEAWKCPEKSLSGTMPEPDEAIEPEWDWMTETTKPGVPRGGVRPFAYGSGHPVAESLWDAIWDAEHERRSYTDDIPLTFPKDLHRFRCSIPVDARSVREICQKPWRYAAENDIPDFTGLWGGFAREAERLFSEKESVSKTGEGKEITWKDLRQGAEAIYKRGLGFLDHLAEVQEYYRPLRAIDPVEWRDMAEVMREEAMK